MDCESAESGRGVTKDCMIPGPDHVGGFGVVADIVVEERREGGRKLQSEMGLIKCPMSYCAAEKKMVVERLFIVGLSSALLRYGLAYPNAPLHHHIQNSVPGCGTLNGRDRLAAPSSDT